MIEISNVWAVILGFYALLGAGLVIKWWYDIIAGIIRVNKAQKAKDNYDWLLKELQDLKKQMENILNK
jgi:hypothetical protein